MILTRRSVDCSAVRKKIWDENKASPCMARFIFLFFYRRINIIIHNERRLIL